jgi:threonine dehydratase
MHPSIDDVRHAHARIRPHVLHTPVFTSDRLNEIARAELYFKCENFQQTGAFKARGATNAVFSLGDEEASRGVATHSSGNHAAALARAARLRGIAAHIVMPSNSNAAKIRAVEHYGGRITFCAPTTVDRETTCARVIAETGATLIHPYLDERVIAGQATVALELLEDVPALNLIVCPVGGGGLLAGTVISAHGLKPALLIVAAEPSGADDFARSIAAGHRVGDQQPDTIADGLRTVVGELNFEIVRPRIHRVITVSEAEIVSAMRTIWETMKIIVEPSAAVAYAPILAGKIPEIAGQRVGIILTGGNVDLDALPW